MKQLCAWCGIALGEAAGVGTSHGICRPCLTRLQHEQGLDLASRLSSLTFPIALVAPDGALLSANGPMAKMLGQPLAALRQRRVQDFLGCDPGHDPHQAGPRLGCVGCQVQVAVRRTWEQGEAIGWPTPLEGRSDPGPSTRFATLPAGDLVALAWRGSRWGTQG